MPCYKPLSGYQALVGGFTTSRQDAFVDRPMTVCCGQCIGCRLERSRQWAIRCVHESQLHTDNCFITLTYDDENLPYAGSLHKPDWVKFMKRLRRQTPPIRFYQCGEYGEETSRPHYHACIFGFRPDDPILYSQNGDHKLYESEFLRHVWGLGHVTFGEMTFETAAYTARYITKKITGDLAEKHYQYTDPETGEIIDRLPPYCNPSRRPGIGLPWLERFGKDTYEKDEIILRGQAMKPPRAYDRQFEITDPKTWQTVRAKRARANFLSQHPVNLDPEIHFSQQRVAGNKINTQKLQERENFQ